MRIKDALVQFEPATIQAMPIKGARVCANCDNLVMANPCPVCGSKHQLHLSVILSDKKPDAWSLKSGV